MTYNPSEKTQENIVVSEDKREVGLTANSLRQETQDIIDSLLADTIHYIGRDAQVFLDSSDAIDASSAALRGKNPSKSFYYKSLSRAIDNEDNSELGIMKSAQKYAFNLKAIVDDRIGEVLSKEDLESLNSIGTSDIRKLLDRSFETKQDLVLVIILMAVLGIKNKMNKVFVSNS